MRRRRTGQGSSLDLFLDTICNAFGGIMFMAILLSVLVQNRSRQPIPVPATNVPMTASEAREVLNQLDVLAAKHDMLCELLVELRKQQPVPEDLAIQNLVKESNTKQKELNESVRKHAEAAKQLALQLESNADIVKSRDEFLAQLIAERAALEKETLALDEALSDQMEVLKLPVVQTSSKSQVYLLMRFQKIYALVSNHESNDNSGLNEADLDFRHYENESFTAAPKSARGWSPTSPELERYLQSCSPSIHVFSVIVWPDSYAEFAVLKEKMITRGYRYDLQPQPNTPSVPFKRGTSNARVQ